MIIEQNSGFARFIYFSFLSLMGIGFFILSIITLVPSEASKLNRLGYYSICSYSPNSTLILIVFSAGSIIGANKGYTI